MPKDSKLNTVPMRSHLLTSINDITCFGPQFLLLRLLQYLSLVRAVGSILELSDVTESMKSMAHAPHDERLQIVAERERQCELITGVLRTLKERIERKDELLHGYERDLAKLRSAKEHKLGCSGLKCFSERFSSIKYYPPPSQLHQIS